MSEIKSRSKEVYECRNCNKLVLHEKKIEIIVGIDVTFITCLYCGEFSEIEE